MEPGGGVGGSPPVRMLKGAAVVVVFALGCALTYGLSDFVGGLLARRISAWQVAVVAQAAAAALTLMLAVVVGGSPDPSDWAWSVWGGIGGGAGAGFLYRGLSGGSMSVVAPISALLAALVPVAAGVATGERPAALTWLGVGCALPAIWLVSRVVDDPAAGRSARRRRDDVVDGILAGLGFGVLFASLGQVPAAAGFGPLTLTHAVGCLTTIVLGMALGAPWVPRERTAAGGAVVGGLAMVATVLFLLATQTGLLSVAAVLASLYPVSTVLLAATVLHERINRGQGAGLALAAVAVALVAAG